MSEPVFYVVPYDVKISWYNLRGHHDDPPISTTVSQVFGPPNASVLELEAMAHRAVAKLESNADRWPYRFSVTVKQA